MKNNLIVSLGDKGLYVLVDLGRIAFFFNEDHPWSLQETISDQGTTAPDTDEEFLEPGGVLIDTESSLDIESLISKFAFGSAE